MVMFVLGSIATVVAYGIYRAVKWVIDDTNSYYEQCRIDAIDREEFRLNGRYEWETDEDVLEREAFYASRKANLTTQETNTSVSDGTA